MKEVLGSKVDPESNKVQKLLSNLHLDQNGEANIGEFRKFSQRCPEVLNPIFILQRRLRARIVGESFWMMLSRKRKNVIANELDAASERVKSSINNLSDSDDEGDAFIVAGEAAKMAEIEARAWAAANSHVGSEEERAQRRIVALRNVRRKRDKLVHSWGTGALDENNSGVDMLLKMEDPTNTGNAQKGVLTKMADEENKARQVGNNQEWRDFGVRRTKGGRNRKGRRRRRMSTAVRFKGSKPAYMVLDSKDEGMLGDGARAEEDDVNVFGGKGNDYEDEGDGGQLLSVPQFNHK